MRSGTAIHRPRWVHSGMGPRAPRPRATGHRLTAVEEPCLNRSVVAPRSALTPRGSGPNGSAAATAGVHPGEVGHAPWVRIALGLLPFLGLAVYAVSVRLMPAAMFHWVYDSEYGPVEIGTAACFAAAGVLAFGLARRTRGIAPPLVRVLYLVFAVGAIFACLEEISYGQHFIGWQSPRWFDQANAQHETNLHNLLQDRPGKLLRNGSLVAVALGGIILPAAATWMGGQYTAGRWAYYLLPRAELVPLVTASLIMRLVRTLPHDLRSGRDTALFEVLELYLAITALVLIVTLRRRLLSGPRPSTAERES
jgi:hypothetical protein